MHMQGCANDVHSFGFRYLFDYKAGGTLNREVMQKVSYGIQPWENPIYPLNTTLLFHTHTRWLEGRGGCFWTQFCSPLIAVFSCGGASYNRHSANERSLTKSSLKWLLLVRN